MENKKLETSLEILDAIGTENEHEGIKATQHFMRLWEEKDREKNNKDKERIQNSRKYSDLEYYRIIAAMLQGEANSLDNDMGNKVTTQWSDKGVILRLHDRFGGKWARAFRPDGNPEVDYNAVVGLLVDLQDTIDQVEKLHLDNIKQLGLIIP